MAVLQLLKLTLDVGIGHQTHFLGELPAAVGLEGDIRQHLDGCRIAQALLLVEVDVIELRLSNRPQSLILHRLLKRAGNEFLHHFILDATAVVAFEHRARDFPLAEAADGHFLGEFPVRLIQLLFHTFGRDFDL
jgi:hypothetical protein